MQGIPKKAKRLPSAPDAKLPQVPCCWHACAADASWLSPEL
jgi:hypothetical protein